MHLTQFTDNAMRCLLILGLAPEQTSTMQAIASQMGMSHAHLAKVVQRLSELGYVETVRGRGGGVRLARPASAIRFGEVIRQTEENLALVECFIGDATQCPVAPACRLAGYLDAALEAFLAVLDSKTLADAIAPRSELLTLLRGTARRAG